MFYFLTCEFFASHCFSTRFQYANKNNTDPTSLSGCGGVDFSIILGFSGKSAFNVLPKSRMVFRNGEIGVFGFHFFGGAEEDSVVGHLQHG